MQATRGSHGGFCFDYCQSSGGEFVMKGQWGLWGVSGRSLGSSLLVLFHWLMDCDYVGKYFSADFQQNQLNFFGFEA